MNRSPTESTLTVVAAVVAYCHYACVLELSARFTPAIETWLNRPPCQRIEEDLLTVQIGDDDHQILEEHAVHNKPRVKPEAASDAMDRDGLAPTLAQLFEVRTWPVLGGLAILFPRTISGRRNRNNCCRSPA